MNFFLVVDFLFYLNLKCSFSVSPFISKISSAHAQNFVFAVPKLKGYCMLAVAFYLELILYLFMLTGLFK